MEAALDASDTAASVNQRVTEMRTKHYDESEVLQDLLAEQHRSDVLDAYFDKDDTFQVPELEVCHSLHRRIYALSYSIPIRPASNHFVNQKHPSWRPWTLPYPNSITPTSAPRPGWSVAVRSWLQKRMLHAKYETVISHRASPSIAPYAIRTFKYASRASSWPTSKRKSAC